MTHPEQTAAHTLGPWKYLPWHVVEGASQVVHATEGWLVCETPGDAYARLIAAAPDMRAALEPFEDLFRDFVGTVNEEWFDRFAKATTDARAAISRAEGRTEPKGGA